MSKTRNSYSPECRKISTFARVLSAHSGTTTQAMSEGRASILLYTYLDSIGETETIEVNGEPILKKDYIEKAIKKIEEKIALNKALNEDDNTFIDSFLLQFTDIIRQKRVEEVVRNRTKSSGALGVLSEADVYQTFCSIFPSGREEMIEQIASLLIFKIDALRNNPNYQGQTLEEMLINECHKTVTDPKTGEVKYFYAKQGGESVNDIISALTAISKKFLAIKYFKDISAKPEDYSEATHKIYDILLNSDNNTKDVAWGCVMYMVRHILLDATHIKIGDKVPYYKEFEDNDEDNADYEEDGTVRDYETEGSEHWMLKTDTISAFASMPKEVRSILYSSIANNGEVGILGYAKLYDVVDAFKKVMGFRTKTFAKNSKEFVEFLKDEKQPWAVSLYNYIQKHPEKRTAIFNVFNKIELNYSHYTRKTEFKKINRGDTENTQVKVFYAESGGMSSDTLVNTYVAKVVNIDPKYKDTVIFDYSGNVRQDRVDGFVRLFNKLKIENNSYVFTEESKKAFIADMNACLNLHLSSLQIDNLMQNRAEFEKFLNAVIKIKEGLSGSKRGSLTTITAVMQESNLSKYFKVLLKTVDYNIDILSIESPVEDSYRYNKSTYYHHTIPNHLGNVMEDFARHSQRGTLKKFLEDTYFKDPIYATATGNVTNPYIIHNALLKALYEEADKPEKPFTTEFLKVTRGLGWTEKEFERFSEKDNILYGMNAYFTKACRTYGGKNIGVVPLFVTGDSNSSRYLNVPILKKDDIIDAMVDAAYQEYKRMEMFQQFIDYCKKYNLSLDDKSSGGIKKNANRFSYFDRLNDEEVKSKLDEVRTKNYKDEMDKEVALKNLLRGYILEELTEKFKGFKSFLKDRNIVQLFESGMVFNNKELFIPEYIDNKGNNKLVNNTEDEIYTYWLNSKLNLLYQLQLLTVDPAFYVSTEDLQKRFKEMIAAGNRLDEEALDPSDTTRPVNNKVEKDDNGHIGEGYQEVIYLSDIKEDTVGSDDNLTTLGKLLKKFLDFDEEKLKPYRKASLTDGQAYRSFSSYRKICVMQGVWTEDMEAAYQIINKSREEYKAIHGSIVGHRLSPKDFEKVLSYNVVFQPLKPFYFGFEDVNLEGGSIMHIPVQLKYSEYPLIPELLPMNNGEANDKGKVTNRLVNLGYVLEDNNIDLAAYTTCVKVGGFANVDISKCKTAEDFNKAFRGGEEVADNDPDKVTKDKQNLNRHIHKHYLSGYKIQSNIPEHFSIMRARGTQAMKHLYGSLLDSGAIDPTIKKKYPFLKEIFGEGADNKPIVISKDKNSTPIETKDGISPRDLVRLVGALESCGPIKAALDFMKKYDSPAKIAKELCSLKADDPRSPKDKLAAYQLGPDGEFRISPAEGIEATDNIAALLSKVRKDIIKQKMYGGSAVQVSAYGFEDVLKMHIVEDNGEFKSFNVDCATPFDFSYTLVKPDGTEEVIQLDYFKYVDSDTGMLKDEKGEPVEAGQGKSKLEKEYPGILDMVSYRIPTEKDYSIIYLKPVRFFPKTCGGTIMVPTVFTAIAGFDFDIDKLYFFRKEFKYKIGKEDTDITNYQIWSGWYNNTPEGQKMFPYLIMERAKDLWNVFKNSAVYNEGENPALKDITSNIFQLKRFIELPNDNARLMFINDNKVSFMNILSNIANDENIKDGTDKVDYIDYYTPARAFMLGSNIEEANTLPQTKEEVFQKYLASEVFLHGWATPIYQYDKNKTLLEQSSTAINNLIVDLFIARLCDEDTIKERFTAGGYLNLKNAKPIMLTIRYGNDEELSEITKQDSGAHSSKDAFKRLVELADKRKIQPSYNPTELSTISHYQTYNAEYDAMIGVSANISINLRLVSLTDKFILVDREDNTPRAFKIGSMIGTNDGTGMDIRKRILNGQDTELNVTEYLTSTVDAVKDALLEYFGINLTTIETAAFLSKIGATPTDVGLLFNQPVVTEALRKVQESEYYLSFSDALQESLESLSGSDSVNLKEAQKKLKQNKNFKETYLTLDNMAASFSPAYRTAARASFLTTQIAAVEAIKDLLQIATEMSDQVNISKTTSANSIKSSFGGVSSTEQRAIAAAATLGNPGSNFDIEVNSKVDPNNRKIFSILNPFKRFTTFSAAARLLDRYSNSPYCVENFAYWAVMTVFDNVLGKLFPFRTKTFTGVADILASFTKRGFLTEDIFNAFNKEFMQFCLENNCELFNDDPSKTVKIATGKIVDGKPDTIDTGVSPRFFYNVIFPYYFNSIIDANQKANGKIKYTDYAIIKALHPEKQGATNYYLRMQNLGNYVNYQKDALIESMVDMWSSEDPILRDLVKHLMLYSYYVAGFEFTRSSFMSLIPLIVKENIGEEVPMTDEYDSYRDFFVDIFHYQLVKNESSNIIDRVKGTSGKTFRIKDFIKAFILLHSQGNNTFYQFSKRLSKKNVKSIDSKFEDHPNYIVVDATKEEASGLYTPVYLQGELKRREFIPCIVVGDDVYMCERNSKQSIIEGKDDSSPYFNHLDVKLANSTTMYYYKMRKPINKDLSVPEFIYEGSELNGRDKAKYGRYCPSDSASYIKAANYVINNIGEDNVDYFNSLNSKDSNRLGEGTKTLQSECLKIVNPVISILEDLRLAASNKLSYDTIVENIRKSVEALSDLSLNYLINEFELFIEDNDDHFSQEFYIYNSIQSDTERISTIKEAITGLKTQLEELKPKTPTFETRIIDAIIAYASNGNKLTSEDRKRLSSILSPILSSMQSMDFRSILQSLNESISKKEIDVNTVSAAKLTDYFEQLVTQFWSGGTIGFMKDSKGRLLLTSPGNTFLKGDANSNIAALLNKMIELYYTISMYVPLNPTNSTDTTVGADDFVTRWLELFMSVVNNEESAQDSWNQLFDLLENNIDADNDAAVLSIKKLRSKGIGYFYSKVSTIDEQIEEGRNEYDGIVCD